VCKTSILFFYVREVKNLVLWLSNKDINDDSVGIDDCNDKSEEEGDNIDNNAFELSRVLRNGFATKKAEPTIIIKTCYN